MEARADVQQRVERNLGLAEYVDAGGEVVLWIALDGAPSGAVDAGLEVVAADRRIRE